MDDKKKHSINKMLKKTQIAVCIATFLTILFEFLFPKIAFVINSDLEYYGVLLIMYFFRISLIIGTLFLTLISLIELCVLWRKHHSFDSINRLLTISAIIIPLLICAWVVIFEPGM